jgi:thiamine pyrophosphate-dependent acetolactate synthase large subunit-like protein
VNRLERVAATRVVLARAEGHPVLANLGSATYDLFAAGDRALNLYTWGAMGQISSVALGLAVARPDRRVIVLDGDGSLLMNLGVLATIAARAPKNLLHLVWDDGSYVTTGGQPTHTAGGGGGEGRTDLDALARAAGYPRVERPATEAALDAVLARALSGEGDGPWFIHVRVAPTRSSSRPPRDPIYFKYRFMAALAGQPLDAGPPLV